jgi:hypothetical protein
VNLDGREYLVPVRGKVVDVATGKPARKEQAKLARIELAKRLGKEGAGKPPRRGPTDLLRSQIYFGIDAETASVIIGPTKFPRQPRLVGASSVPELLEEGGAEYIGDELVRYQPHPFVAPSLDPVEAFFRKTIESEPL